MSYIEVMEAFSQTGIGAVVIGGDGVILLVNDAGDRLLHGKGLLKGKMLKDIAPELCAEPEKRQYANVAFGEYLLRCPSPNVNDLPKGSRLVVFRDASSDFGNDILHKVINQVSESIIISDSKSRIYFINDAAVKMDELSAKDIIGEPIREVYHSHNSPDLLVPQVIEDKRPLLNTRQNYTTKYGKNVDIMSNNYPAVQNGQVIGGFSIMEDWSNVDSLNKKILDLQEKLLEHKKGKTPGKSALSAHYTFEDINYISSSMSTVVEQCKRVAQSDSSVMIYGETGTGKEMFAQSIHNASMRANGPFLAINCAAIPENLLESMLFGTEKGAYTGAERRAGLFEQASGGTLLLDEINSMNINLQAKLLRVLQEGVIRRVGGMSDIRVDVRVLSNINMPPYEAIEQKRLRSDLYYRLGVVNIQIPPLRERTEDIPLLVKCFIIRCNKKMSCNIQDADERAYEVFRNYSWPGNVRELQHAIEHAMNILPENMDVITPEYLPDHITGKNISPAYIRPQSQNVPDKSLGSSMQEMEINAIRKALKETSGNISEAARHLQMSRQNLQYRIKRYKINTDEFRK